jgi:membrane protein DedA with SNARE-associated domain
MDPLSRSIAHYGYAGLFVMLALAIAFLPIPGETLLVIAGVLAARGKLHLALAAAASVAGCAAGISFSYGLGRTAAAPLIARYGRYVHITPEYIERVHAWFQKTGEWILTFGYFVPGVRHFTALVAGMSRLEYRTFALFAYPGAFLWVGTFMGLGYFLGDNWESAMLLVHQYTYLAITLGALIAGLAYLVKRRLRKSSSPPTPVQSDHE